MPFCLSRIHSSLTCQGPFNLVDTRLMWQSPQIQPLLPRIRGWNLILLWWLSFYAHSLQVRRSLIISCVQCVRSYIIGSVHKPGVAIVFACSYHKLGSGQIPFPCGSSQQSGWLTPLQVTQSSSEALWAFLPDSAFLAFWECLVSHYSGSSLYWALQPRTHFYLSADFSKVRRLYFLTT